MKVGAVDYLTGQHVIFSNKIPEHKEFIFLGVVASMCIVPLFLSFAVKKPQQFKLVEKTHSLFDSILLIDGGYRASLLLEEAIRESGGYDAIFIIDISGLEYEEVDPKAPYNLVTKIQRAQSIASTTNDRLRQSLVDRIDEEIQVRDEFIKLKKFFSDPFFIDQLIERMNNGRLRLGDKHTTVRGMISNPRSLIPFDFSNFTQGEVAHLMRAGHNAALRMLRQLGLSTEGLPLIKPR